MCLMLTLLLLSNLPDAPAGSDPGEAPVVLTPSSTKRRPNAPRTLAIEAAGATGARLHTVPLLATKNARWSLREGVGPVIETFHIRTSDRAALRRAQGSPVTLTLGAGANRIDFRNLWILDFPPGPNPHVTSVRVADRRWFWPEGWVLKRFNMRRKVGSRRATAPNAAPAGEVLPRFRYQPWSTKSANAETADSLFSAKEALFEVLERIQEIDRERSGSNFSVISSDDISDELPLEDLELDDPGDRALSRILRYLPGMALFVNRDGNVVLYSKAALSSQGVAGDEAQRQKALHEVVDFGHVEHVTKSHVRPREIHVLFSYECEVRFDYVEQNDGTTVVDVGEKARTDSNLLTQMIEVPDFSLTIDGDVKPQGAWVELAKALSAWGESSKFGALVTLQDIRRAFAPGLDPFSGFVAAAAGSEPDVAWAARIAAIVEHYRRSFRIPQGWLDRILSLRAYRVAIIDQATGARAPAPAWADYAIRLPGRAFFGSQTGTPEDDFLSMNVQGYPRNGPVIDPSFGIRAFDSSSRPIPATVSVPDQDQGIVQLNFQQMPLLGHAGPFQFFPGNFSNVPVSNISQRKIVGGPSVAWGASGANRQDNLPEIDADWKLAIILTAIPAAPNSTRQLYRIVVTPEQVDDLVPGGVGPARGPVKEVRVSAALETARLMWVDSFRTQIQKLFGITASEGEDVQAGIEQLVINRPRGVQVPTRVQATGLDAIARAEAARIYASFRDHLEGEMAGSMAKAEAPDLRPDGSLEEVGFEIFPDGRAFVRLSFPEEIEELDMFSYLDPGTRAQIMRLAQGGLAV